MTNDVTKMSKPMNEEEMIDTLKGLVFGTFDRTTAKEREALDMAITALEQQPITWIVGKDNCQVAVRNMPIDKMQKICAIIGEEEQQPSEDAISREDAIRIAEQGQIQGYEWQFKKLCTLPSVTPSNDAIREAYIKGYDYGVKDWFKAKTELCDDCVSREDALKAIEEQKKGFYGVERYAIDECHSAVMKLPSVRPYKEIVEDKRACENCIHYVTRDSKGVVLCGCDSWECDFEEVKT